MPAGLLIGHDAAPDGEGIEVAAVRLAQALRLGREQARDKTVGQKPRLRVASVGAEAKADNRPAALLHVGLNRDHIGGHGRERNHRVAHW